MKTHKVKLEKHRLRELTKKVKESVKNKLEDIAEKKTKIDTIKLDIENKCDIYKGNLTGKYGYMNIGKKKIVINRININPKRFLETLLHEIFHFKGKKFFGARHGEDGSDAHRDISEFAEWLAFILYENDIVNKEKLFEWIYRGEK